MELSYLQRWNQLRWQLARAFLAADCLFNWVWSKPVGRDSKQRCSVL